MPIVGRKTKGSLSLAPFVRILFPVPFPVFLWEEKEGNSAPGFWKRIIFLPSLHPLLLTRFCIWGHFFPALFPPPVFVRRARWLRERAPISPIVCQERVIPTFRDGYQRRWLARRSNLPLAFIVGNGPDRQTLIRLLNLSWQLRPMSDTIENHE